MAKPYSYDLREKVINTIDLWLKRKAQTGDFKPRLNCGLKISVHTFLKPVRLLLVKREIPLLRTKFSLFPQKCLYHRCELC